MELTEKSNYFPNDKGWWELPESCLSCNLPMHLASGKPEAFCPNCYLDARTAETGRWALAVAKHQLALLEAKVRQEKKEPRLFGIGHGFPL